MRLLAVALSAALAAMALAGPAQAAGADDLLFDKDLASPLTEDLIGYPWWRIQAQCAGIFAAGFSHFTAIDKRETARELRSDGGRMLMSAIDRLMLDRGLDRGGAFELVREEAEVGRISGVELLAGGVHETGRWNIQRSLCLEAFEVYRKRVG